jgi:hypothetical protein
MTNAADQTPSDAKAEKKPTRRAVKPRLSPLEVITAEELQTLRLDDNARADFDACVQRFYLGSAGLKALDGEDVGAMDDASYERFSAVKAEQHSSGMAVVHFLAPRILKMRDGAAKRKWRSFLAKYRKDERLG